jgi:hypothetical protein
LRRIFVRAVVVAIGMLAGIAGSAHAQAGVEHLHFAAGPYRITPGANLILLDYKHVPKPAQDGFMIRMAPNLHYSLPNGRCCGAIPRTDLIHLHHGVWLSNGTAGEGEGNGSGGFYPFMASGEEKTIYQFPSGYGYPVRAHDYWVLNYMIHDLTAKAARVYITYDIDFIPATSPLAAKITPIHPIWMDVEDHQVYPVFDVQRYSGHGGKFTFPDMAKHPYRSGPPPNEFTVDHAGTLVGTAGHLHPGGLYDDLDLIRAGARPPKGAIRGHVSNSVRLFRSSAHYFDPRGPISWDMAMTATPPDWRVQLKPGDEMRISATYETRRASWYESMGIMVVWEAWGDTSGVNPFAHQLDERGHVTHGHLKENNNHGGTASLYVNPATLPSCSRKQVLIAGFTFLPGDLSSAGAQTCAPTVKRGKSLTFVNEDASPLSSFGNLFSPSPFYLQSIFHSITTCQNPCGLNTGISYPLANGPANYDSGQLGIGTPAVGRISWTSPTSLAPGTYTYFCRIHPFMRGVFRIVAPK